MRPICDTTAGDPWPIRHLAGARWAVLSRSRLDYWRVVNLDRAVCSCPAWRRDRPCFHLQEVRRQVPAIEAAA